MRARQFFALNKQIGLLLKEEEARALAITHHGKPGERLRELLSEINAKRKIRVASESSRALILRGEAQAVSAERIEAERERQKAATEEIMKDKDAWIRKMHEQRAHELSGVPSQSGS